jgi:HK97 family phage prohead protease
MNYARFAALELRVASTAERIVEGIVVPWNETSYLTDDPKGERFIRGSLSRSIRQRGERIKLFRGHDHRRAVGTPLGWEADRDAGAWASFHVAETGAGEEVLAEMREGLLDAFSIGFEPVRERRGADGAREIVEAKLLEVSLVPLAYDGARVLATRAPAPELVGAMPAVNLEPIPPVHHWTR